MISRRRIALALAAVTIAAGLAACGGDEDRVIVPDVEGLGVQAGIDRVCGRFLEPALTVDPSAAAAEPSVLVGSDPAAGVEVEVGSTVTLLSTPPPDGVTVVPEPSCDAP
mgnify:CR=1 FL=1